MNRTDQAIFEHGINVGADIMIEQFRKLPAGDTYLTQDQVLKLLSRIKEKINFTAIKNTQKEKGLTL
jgi:hypothetical protein